MLGDPQIPPRWFFARDLLAERYGPPKIGSWVAAAIRAVEPVVLPEHLHDSAVQLGPDAMLPAFADSVVCMTEFRDHYVAYGSFLGDVPTAPHPPATGLVERWTPVDIQGVCYWISPG